MMSCMINSNSNYNWCSKTLIVYIKKIISIYYKLNDNAAYYLKVN